MKTAKNHHSINHNLYRRQSQVSENYLEGWNNGMLGNSQSSSEEVPSGQSSIIPFFLNIPET
ncbi:MAG: hypothetical protein HY063_00305 [Bacteroidetes bacterium]|nr:hypothetical protein [Bacteroidota bacterium]